MINRAEAAPRANESPRHESVNVREEVQNRTGAVGRAIDRIGTGLASPMLFFALLLAHFGWVLANLRVLDFLPSWDPYPYPLLATITSALAPFVSLLILMRQHRDARIAELREELELQIALETERKTVLVVRMLDELRSELRLPTRIASDELEEGKRLLPTEEMLDSIRSRLDKAEHDHVTGRPH